MRLFAIAAFAFALAPCAAFAQSGTNPPPDSPWGGPGWYEWEDDFLITIRTAGPFGDQATCQADANARGKPGDYFCEYDVTADKMGGT